MTNRLILLAALSIAAAAPAAAQQSPGLTRFGDPVEGTFRHNSQIVRAGAHAIRSEADWQRLWATMTRGGSYRPLPQVDFSREMLLVAAMGARSSGGYAIRITGVRETRRALTVSVLRRSLGPRCGATAAITEPADIVRVPMSTKPIRWVYRDVAPRCS
jgi:hypothetical protein